MNPFENLFTPPTTTDEKKQELEAEKARLKAESDMHSAFADMIANAMLESDMPDFKKASIRLLMKAKKVSNQINDIVDTYADPVKDEEKDKDMYPVRQEAYDFLGHIESEITEFINSHPFDTRE